MKLFSLNANWCTTSGRSVTVPVPLSHKIKVGLTLPWLGTHCDLPMVRDTHMQTAVSFQGLFSLSDTACLREDSIQPLCLQGPQTALGLGRKVWRWGHWEGFWTFPESKRRWPGHAVGIWGYTTSSRSTPWNCYCKSWRTSGLFKSESFWYHFWFFLYIM